MGVGLGLPGLVGEESWYVCKEKVVFYTFAMRIQHSCYESIVCS